VEYWVELMMATLNRLTDRQVTAFVKPEAAAEPVQPGAPKVKAKTKMLADGGGLFLVVLGGSSTWQLKFMHERKSRTMGLGPYPHVPLALARERANTYRTQLKRDRVDPLTTKRAEEAAKVAGENARLESAAKGMTFKDAVSSYLRDHGKRWTDPKAVPDWKASLRWAEAIVGDLNVSDVDRQLVLKVLKQDVEGEPLWTAKPVQAKRVRARIQAVLEWAVQHELRGEGPNPAEWSRLKAALPAHSRVHKVKHHEHVPVEAVPAFMVSLRVYQAAAEARREKAALAVIADKRSTMRALEKAENDALAAKALEFVMLTATRTGDVVGLRWAELDLDAALWVIPAERFKGRRDVRVPLSVDALAILAGLKSNREPKAQVFTFSNRDKAMYNVMRTLHASFDPHGAARGSFRTWCAANGVPSEVAEAALGHVAGNAVVQAYQHSDFYEARVPIMEAWALHCRGGAKPTGESKAEAA
jgi:integrase